MNFNEEALKLHAEHKGKIEIRSKVPVNTRDDLSTAYTAGVAEAVPGRSMQTKRKYINIRPRETWWPWSLTGPPFWGWEILDRRPLCR